MQSNKEIKIEEKQKIESELREAKSVQTKMESTLQEKNERRVKIEQEE